MEKMGRRVIEGRGLSLLFIHLGFYLIADRDFALLEFALMGQIVETDHVLFARTHFRIDGSPVDWTLLFVPDTASMAKLHEVLG